MEEEKVSYAEVDEILNYIDEEYVKRIPEKVRDFFKEERDENYKLEVDINRPLEEQNLKRKTMVILAILNMNYWCDKEEEKKEIIESLNKNEEIYQKEIREKYNPDNIFKNKDNQEDDITNVDENTQLVEYEKNGIIQRILNKIKNFFRRKDE